MPRVAATIPNQINNVLAFPGIFAGAFDCGACTITEGMKLAAATALGDVVWRLRWSRSGLCRPRSTLGSFRP